MLLLSTGNLYSSHFFGGQLHYECLGSETFKIYMIAYQNCGESNNSPWEFDPASKLHIFDSQGNLVYSQSMPHVEVPLDSLNVPDFDSCLQIPNDVCIHYRIRSATVLLPFSPGGYIATFQRCCLGDEIVNVKDPEKIGINLNLYISDLALSNCNNSPTFNFQSPGFFCKGTSFRFDHSAFDNDGDSLVYDLVIPDEGPDDTNISANPPLIPPYSNLELLDDFDKDNLFGSNSEFNIDQSTGEIFGVVRDTGLYMIGVRVSEYRFGQLFSQVVRTLVYSVDECNPLIESKFDFSLQCSGNIVEFNNLSINATEFCWNFQSSSDCANFSPTLEFEEEGNYLVTLIAEPDNSCSDTSAQVVVIEKPCGFQDFELGIVIEGSSDEKICKGDSLELMVMYCDGYEYIWNITSDIEVNSHNLIVKPDTSTIYSVSVFDGDNCIWNSEILIEVVQSCRKELVSAPNIFSPNDDGVNDSFSVYNDIAFQNFDLSIYSRWGELIFQTGNVQDRWDGSFRNIRAIEDVYIWVLNYSFLEGNMVIRDSSTGNVTLIR